MSKYYKLIFHLVTLRPPPICAIREYQKLAQKYSKDVERSLPGLRWLSRILISSESNNNYRTYLPIYLCRQVVYDACASLYLPTYITTHLPTYICTYIHMYLPALLYLHIYQCRQYLMHVNHCTYLPTYVATCIIVTTYLSMQEGSI